MTISVFSPSPGIVDGRGDSSYLMQKAIGGGAVTPVVGKEMEVGTPLEKFLLPHAAFFRFEIDLPIAPVIIGWRLKLTGANNNVGATVKITGGFCRRQNNARPWEAFEGIRVWDLEDDIPFALFNSFVGVISDLTVWQDDQAAFEEEDLTIVPLGGDFSIGEGTLSGANNVTGMISQLTAYLADPAVEATRGDTAVDAISALIQMHPTPWGAVNEVQWVWNQNDIAFPDRSPILEIEWDPPLSRLASTSSLSPAIETRSALRPAVDSTAAIRTALESKASLVRAVKSSSTIRATVDSKGSLA